MNLDCNFQAIDSRHSRCAGLAVTDTEKEMQKRWLGWQIGMESKGLKVNIGKTEVLVSSRRGTKANIKDSQGTSLRQVNKFKYLGVTVSEEGGSEEAVRARVSAAWGKWRDLSGVISEKDQCQEKDQGGDQEGDGWIASEGICRHCGLPWRLPRTEHYGNQEFWPLTPPRRKRRRRRRLHITKDHNVHKYENSIIFCLLTLYKVTS